VSDARLDVGVLGATGTVGQQLIAALDGHPWFRVRWLAASARSAGRAYAEAAPWRVPAPLPDAAARLMLDAAEPERAPRLVFSALGGDDAGDIERAFAAAGHLVVSNARSHRMDPRVPLVVPEINPDHLGLLREQAAATGWDGAIVTNPNCSTVVLSLALAPLRRFGLRSVMVSTLQAISGAGYPGVPSLDIVGNVIPFIDGEEAKIEGETRKILGRLSAGAVEPHPVVVSAQASRVPVLNGHTETVSVGFERAPSEQDLLEAFARFTGRPQQAGLPSAPPRPLVHLGEPDRPQPRLDADRGRGMAVSIGRLRRCPVLDWKFVALGHNTIRGAAGAAILNAELMKADGLLA
jgi:aspartate-semialdehyde dehydrogenase